MGALNGLIDFVGEAEVTAVTIRYFSAPLVSLA